MSSGASIAPPERLRSSAVVTPAPGVLTRSARQRRSDVQAMPKLAVSEEEEEEEDAREDHEDKDGGDEDSDEESGDEEEGVEGEGDEEEGSEEEGVEEEGGEGGEEEGGGEEGGEEEGGEDERVDQGEKGSKGKDGKNDSSENHRKPLTPPLSTPTASGDLVDVETHQRGRSTTPKVVVDGDIQMTSPQNSPPKLHGASRTSGGIFRGHATGNVLNAADFLNTDNDEYIGPVRGQINIYLSEDDPARLSPDSLTAYARLSYDYAAKTPIAPVLERVARRYSPVRR